MACRHRGTRTGRAAHWLHHGGRHRAGWTLVRKAMAELGYVDGRTVALEFRNADTASGRLVVNQKTARAIGLAIRPIFLARADEVLA
jgi:hypothetical protein